MVVLFIGNIQPCISTFFFPSQIHILPVPVNHTANVSALRSVCEACNKSYRALDSSYKKIAGSDSQEYKVCADVSASVSMNYTQNYYNLESCLYSLLHRLDEISNSQGL